MALILKLGVTWKKSVCFNHLEVSHGTGYVIRGGPEARTCSGVHSDSNEDAKGDGSTASSALIKEKSQDISEIRKQSRYLSLYEEEIAFTKDFVAKTVAISDSIKVLYFLRILIGNVISS